MLSAILSCCELLSKIVFLQNLKTNYGYPKRCPGCELLSKIVFLQNLKTHLTN